MLKQQITLQVQQPHITFNPPTLNLHPRFPFPSSCLGLPVLLTRPLCQGQLNTDMGNTEISDTDTDTGGNGAQFSLSPPSHHSPSTESVCRILYTIYIYRIPTAESCIPNPTAQFAQLCDDNGKHFYCVSTSLSVLLLFCLVPFFVVVSSCCCSICCADCCCCCCCGILIFVAGVCMPLYGFDFNFWAQQRSREQQRRNPFLSPLTRSCFDTLQWIG